jgi:hypothetical protein
MTTKPLSDVPASRRKIYRRFERRRSSHSGRLPIPQPLWKSAAEVAREHGVFRTAKILRLEYNKLKRMVESNAPVKRARRVSTSPAEFVELVAPHGAVSGLGLSGCLIELKGPRGKMRIHWKGATAHDLAGLTRALWEPA